MENQATMSDFDSILASRGVTRRSFMKLCAGIAAAAGLSQLAVPRVAQALEESVIGATSGNLYPVIWIEGASCTGCTESFAQVETPDVASVVLDMISLNYSETLSAAAGHSMRRPRPRPSQAATTFSPTRAPCSRPSTATLCAWPARPASRPLWRLPSRPTPLWRSAPAP